MNVRFVAVAAVAVVGASLLNLSSPADAQDSAEPPRFTPGLSDLMTMLVQPRHVKLYQAGTRKNWELAAFQLRELRSSFRRIGQAIPNYRGSGVDQSVAGIIGPSLDAVGTAISAADARQFETAFANLTASCNACHAYMEHPFLVMRVPDAGMKGSPYSDQEFKPSP